MKKTCRRSSAEPAQALVSLYSLEQRIPGEASFLLDETMLYRYAPYFLLPYGRSLTVRVPAALKQKLAAVAADTSAYYAEP
ncbi:hypothetical protein [Paenibacillus camerounensis]|uniref:hypothetical protein n=1 Tax=Paenibacillus camerounensis TaxID=1243663 RepID=UPI0012FCF008|nr:hypothetical protein [Paenibacillus camerounensis]